VTVDSLRADFLGCYGGDMTVGVSMCALGERSARYAWAFSPSSESAPAIASLFTSTYPRLHGVDESGTSFLRDASTSVVEELRRAGYATAAFVGSPELNRSRNLHQGFDLYDDRMDEREPAGLGERRAEALTHSAIAWIRETPTPWFAWIHYRDPHGPYDAPRAASVPGTVRTDDSLPERRGERLRLLATPNGRGGIPGYQALPGLFTRQAYEVRYRAEIRYVDGQLARLLAAVDATTSPTGVLLTADHGEAFGEDRYFFTHGHSVGLDQIRVPLFWRPPPGALPGRTATPVTTLDVAPTLLRAAALSVPDSFEGRPLPQGSESPRAHPIARAIFAEGPRQVAVVHEGIYYARDRDPAASLAAGSFSRDGLARANARIARLDERATDNGRLPRYRSPEPERARALEPRLAEFLFSDSPERHRSSRTR
jgi:arylsulfatase